jgi:ferric-dicitrate binding protein FerR (iron transport regulator)
MNNKNDHIEVPEFIYEYISNPEKLELEAKVSDWLKNESNKKIFIELYHTWRYTKVSQYKHNLDTDEAWRSLKNSVPLHQRRKPAGLSQMTKRFLQRVAVAASVFILVSATVFLGFNLLSEKQRPIQYTEYTVPYSSLSKVILPDSSVVWINAGSSLKYNSDFGFNNRDVYLNGEAFFDVAPDEKLPFEVKLNKVSFRAIGTSFNIKAYEEDKYIEAIVEEGKIQLKGLNKKNRKNNSLVYLVANEKLIIKNNSQIRKNKSSTQQNTVQANKPLPSLPRKTEITYQIITDINPEIPTSWKEEEWIIDRERFEDFAIMLQRRYDVQIVFKDQSLKDFTFSGIIKNETLEQMLKAIYLTTPIEYKIEGNVITLTKNKRFKSKN